MILRERERARARQHAVDPAPAHIPTRGVVTLARPALRRAFSFTGRAFPSGPLRISLLVPLR